MNIKKFGDYLCSLESVYVLGLIVITIINLILSNSLLYIIVNLV